MSARPEPAALRDDVLVCRFPVHRACRDGDVAALLPLLQQLPGRAHLTAEDPSRGWTPLHWAAHHGQLECVVHLVQMGCEVNMATSLSSQTPAHTAATGGRPHCVLWLIQAGADVDRQDSAGEAPIHKAARSGSLECIQVLLIAGAQPHLRNASGQTAADLAHAHGFHDCFLFMSKTQKHLLQLGGVHVNGVHHGNAASCGQDPLSRKRLLAAVDAGHMKRARRAQNVLLQMQSGEGEELESMSTEPPQQLGPDDPKANGHHHAAPREDRRHPEPPRGPSSLLPPSANQQAAASVQRSSADMCGSLHLTGSPSSCVSHRPAWWGLMGADCMDFLHYGHFHGFGDTAEELSDGRSVQVEHKSKAPLAGTIHLYHGS